MSILDNQVIFESAGRTVIMNYPLSHDRLPALWADPSKKRVRV